MIFLFLSVVHWQTDGIDLLSTREQVDMTTSSPSNTNQESRLPLWTHLKFGIYSTFYCPKCLETNQGSLDWFTAKINDDQNDENLV